MQLYGVLVLFVTLSAACGLICYECATGYPQSCTGISACPASKDRCGYSSLNGFIIKGCSESNACVSPIKCCEGDLCNSAISTGSSVLLLLVSSVIITLFL